MTQLSKIAHHTWQCIGDAQLIASYLMCMELHTNSNTTNDNFISSAMRINADGCVSVNPTPENYELMGCWEFQVRRHTCLAFIGTSHVVEEEAHIKPVPPILC